MKSVKLFLAAVLLVSFSACTHAPGTVSGGISGAGAGGAVSTRAAVAAAFTKPVSFSLLQDYPKGEDINDVVQDFQLLKDLGVTTWRGSFSWIDYEPKRGKFDFAWLHRFLKLADKEGVTLRPYLAYTPAWAAKGGSDKEVWNDPPKRISDWRSFVSRMMKELQRYRNIPSVEIYNEENVKQWWDGTAQEYNAVLKTASEVIKSTNPSTEVIMGGMVWPDTEWVEQACVTYGNAKKFDVVPIHAYPETWTPKNITVENYLDQGRPGYFRREFVPLVDRSCSRKPIWLNEVGFATAPGKTEADQANWWARAIGTFLADPRVEHLGIYQIRDRKPEAKVIGESENYYLGLTRADRTKKLAFHTVKRLVRLLNNATLTVADAELGVEVTEGKQGELYHHLFVLPDGRQVLLAWDKKGSPTLRFHTRKGSEATEYGLDGSPIPYPNFSGRTLSNVRLQPGVVRIFEIR